MDGQTDRHRTMASTADAWHRAEKLQVWLAEVDVLRHRHVDTLQLMKPALAAVTLQALLLQSPVLIRGT